MTAEEQIYQETATTLARILAEGKATRSDFIAQAMLEGAGIYLAVRLGPRKAAEHFYRLADAYAVMPEPKR